MSEHVGSDGGAAVRVAHAEEPGGGAFHLERDGKRVAEMTWVRSRRDPTVAIIEHTFVDPSLRGQGLAERLVVAAVEWARRTGTKIRPVCPYAKAVFDREPSLADVRAR